MERSDRFRCFCKVNCSTSPTKHLRTKVQNQIMWINNSFPNIITNYLGLGAGVFIVGGEEAQLGNIKSLRYF